MTVESATSAEKGGRRNSRDFFVKIIRPRDPVPSTLKAYPELKNSPYFIEETQFVFLSRVL